MGVEGPVYVSASCNGNGVYVCVLIAGANILPAETIRDAAARATEQPACSPLAAPARAHPRYTPALSSPQPYTKQATAGRTSVRSPAAACARSRPGQWRP